MCIVCEIKKAINDPNAWSGVVDRDYVESRVELLAETMVTAGRFLARVLDGTKLKRGEVEAVLAAIVSLTGDEAPSVELRNALLQERAKLKAKREAEEQGDITKLADVLGTIFGAGAVTVRKIESMEGESINDVIKRVADEIRAKRPTKH